MSLRDDGSFRLNMDYFGYLDGLAMTNERFADLFRPLGMPVEVVGPPAGTGPPPPHAVGQRRHPPHAPAVHPIPEPHQTPRQQRRRHQRLAGTRSLLR